jgi:AcrR family transcriptional regulator
MATGRGRRPSTAAEADPGSRQRILDAALELMAERGFAGTSISMICERSGLPPSSTYWHFGSKEGLLAATVDYGASHWLRALPRWEQLTGDPETRLRRMLTETATSLSRRPAFLRVLFVLPLERGDMDPDSLEIIRSVRRRASGGFRHAFREMFAAVDDPEAEQICDRMARFALALVDGAFIAYEIERDRREFDDLFDRLATAFLLMGEQYAASKGRNGTKRAGATNPRRRNGQPVTGKP